jgi:hypothetical protein
MAYELECRDSILGREINVPWISRDSPWSISRTRLSHPKIILGQSLQCSREQNAGKCVKRARVMARERDTEEVAL